jgi:hypothetical protein
MEILKESVKIASYSRGFKLQMNSYFYKLLNYVDLVEFFECELKFLVLFGVSVKFIFEDFEIFVEPVDLIFTVHVLNFMISDDLVQLPFILFIRIDFVGEFFKFVFVLSLSFFLGGLEFFDLSIDSGDDFLLKLVFAFDFGGVKS